MLGNKLKVIADTIFGEEVVKSKANEFVQEREDTGLAGIKLDFSHKLLYRFQSSLYGIRNSMTDTWYRIKSAVMPGRRVSADEINRLAQQYNEISVEKQPTNEDLKVQVINVTNADFDGLDLKPLEVGNRLDTVGVAPPNTVSTQKNGIEEEVSKPSRIGRLQQVLQGEFAKIKFEKNAKELDRVIARQEEKLKEDIDTPSLTVPAVSEKIGLVQRITDFFKNLFSARATESSETVGMMYGDAKYTNALDNGNYVSFNTEINYPSLNSTTSQGRAETPPPPYEEAIGQTEGKKPPFQREWNSVKSFVEEYIITPTKSLFPGRSNENSTEKENSLELATLNTGQGRFEVGDLYEEVEGKTNPLAKKETTQEKLWSEKHPSKGSSTSWSEQINTRVNELGRSYTDL